MNGVEEIINTTSNMDLMHALMTEVETTLSRIIQHSRGVCMIKRIPCDKIHLLIVHYLCRHYH